MKKLLLATILLLAVQTSSAQLFKMGIKAGALVSNQTMSYSDGGIRINKNSVNPGFEVGLQFQVNIPVVPIFIQPELLYSYTSANFDDAMKVKTSSFDIPVMVGVRILFLRAYLGPVFSFPSSDVIGGDAFKPQYRSTNIGYQFGVGANIGKRLTIDARFGGNFDDATTDNITTSNLKNSRISGNRWAFSLGYTLFKVL